MECGACETKCPQNIEIRKQLKDVVSVLNKKRNKGMIFFVIDKDMI